MCFLSEVVWNIPMAAQAAHGPERTFQNQILKVQRPGQLARPNRSRQEASGVGSNRNLLQRSSVGSACSQPCSQPVTNPVPRATLSSLLNYVNTLVSPSEQESLSSGAPRCLCCGNEATAVSSGPCSLPGPGFQAQFPAASEMGQHRDKHSNLSNCSLCLGSWLCQLLPPQTRS